MFITFSFRIICPFYWLLRIAREDTSQAKDFGFIPFRLLEAALLRGSHGQKYYS
jgi:hypothetical protein